MWALLDFDIVACPFTKAQIYEHAAMVHLRPLLPRPSTVHIPSFLSFDETAQTILITDAGKLPILKTWLSTAISLRLVERVGSSIGLFLADVHGLGFPARSHFAGNRRAREISALVYFGRLPAAAAKFGHDDSDGTIAKAAAQTERKSWRKIRC